MRNLLASAIACVAMASAAFPVVGAPRIHLSDALAMHGVWYSRDVYLPFYSDAELVEYLASIPTDGILLPVYSPVPIHFRRGDTTFVSTGLVLEARSEHELLQAIGGKAASAVSSGNADRFRDLQAKLATQIADYAEATRPQLRRR